MTSNDPSNSVDYSPIKSPLEKKFLNYLLQKVIGDTAVAIKYSESEILNLSNQEDCVSFFPPPMRVLLGILRNPRYYLPEAFVDGHWTCDPDELPELILRLYNRNNKRRANNFGFSLGIGEFMTHVRKQYLDPATRREVRGHYNEDPDLYLQVIGESLVYSCAFFDSDDMTLDEAQSHKINTTYERLNIDAKPGDRILNIGCGWGSFEAQIALTCPADFDGITISEAQTSYAQKRCKQLAPDVSKRIHFHCCDYTDFLPRQDSVYDGIVSIGMLEHVGKAEFSNYFRVIERLLKPGARAVVHSITRFDDGITSAWIDRHIFPGGYVPRISEVVRGVESSGLSLEACHRHDGTNYQRTLECWRRNLMNNRGACEEVIERNLRRQQDGDKATDKTVRCAFRIWQFYLSSIQSIFDKRGGGHDVTQFVVTKANQ